MGRSVAPVVVAFVSDVDWGKEKPKDVELDPKTAEFVARDVVPAVDARYRTRSDPAHRA